MIHRKKSYYPPKQAEEKPDSLNIESIDIEEPIEEMPNSDINSIGNDNYDLYGDDDLGDYGGGDISTPMEKHSDLLKQLTNFGPFIKDKINGWLGLTWDAQTEKWINDSDVEPIMNKKCAAWCIDYLKTYTRDNNIITNIGKDEYSNIVDDIIEVVWLGIGTRMEDFEIHEPGDLYRVCVELQHAAELVLMGAGGGKYNELLSTATSRHETVNLSDNGGGGGGGGSYGMPQRKKEGMIGKIKKWVGG